jgi:hypothetical protein
VHLAGVEEMTIFSEELKSLIKNHLRHSLCSTPVSIQSRIYLDDEEISNLRQEKPAPKELSDEEIKEARNKKEVNEPNAFINKEDGLVCAKCFKPFTEEWQYLTDDEIKGIVGSYGNGLGGYTRELFDKIEAKIKEKNDILSR